MEPIFPQMTLEDYGDNYQWVCGPAAHSRCLFSDRPGIHRSLSACIALLEVINREDGGAQQAVQPVIL